MKQTRTLTFAVLLTLLCIPALSRAQQTLTVYNGTETSDHVPAYIYYWDDFTRSQFVIPADSLTAMDGGTIRALTFYTNESNVPFSSLSTVDVYLKEVSGTTLSDFVSKSSATVVYSGTIDIEATGSGGQMTITFSTPYSYSGGNLLVGIENTTDMGYRNIYFYGKTVTGASGANSDPNSLDNVTFQQQNFIPTTTFTFTNWEFGDTMAYCGVNADNVRTFTMMNYCDAAAVKYPASMMAGRNYLRSLFFYVQNFSTASDFTISVSQEEVDGEPQLENLVFTGTYSTGEFSPGWVEFPTPGCQLDDSKPLWVIINIEGMPYVETDIREGNAQIVHWISTDKWKPIYDGQSSSYAQFNTRMWPLYAVTSATEPVYTDCSVALDLPFTCGFEPSDNLDCWTFIDADGDGYGWYSHDGRYVSESFNISDFELNPDNWMITPRLHIPAEGATLEWTDISLYNQDFAEHYSVLVSTTGTETSDFTGNIFETTLTQGETLVQRSASLASYAGQDVYIAFRHHDSPGHFILAIDDISVTAGTEGIDNPQYSSLNSRLSIFPNPTTGVVTLRAEVLREVSILDLNGRTVANHQFVISNPGIQNSEFTIDLSDLPAGLYLLRIVTDNGVTMQKILKE